MFTRERLTRWTTYLRNNPHLQYRNALTNYENDKFCCLGALCHVEGLVCEQNAEPNSLRWGYGKEFDMYGLPAELAVQAGTDKDFNFGLLNMPNLKKHVSAAHANDDGATWAEIADHLDKFYPCKEA